MLPEYEQRQLQEIEQALCRDDPKFVRLMRTIDPRVHHGRKLIPALLWVVIGIGLLSAGAVTHRLYLEAVGVVIVVLSLLWAAVSWRRYVDGIRPARSRAAETTTAKQTKHRSEPTRRARMMERMEQRWRRRQEGNGGLPGRIRS